MPRRTICKRMLFEKEMLQMLYNLSEIDSGFVEKSGLSQDAYIPGNESEPTSSDECFTENAQDDFSSENEGISSINTGSQHTRSA
ncbi:hypothetical protein AVEN_236566-1 [Araneus ventricosus]|uniref:Uncharacterized protein n=1 Tax=Araneus ventricosus TaxID=182803 RepID=A0A4Y2FNF9_ARAVE|nr:hypothetical protein AVEN_236566-1 [Araneus ventricosus]